MALNGKAQETPSQGRKTFLRNHAERIASIGLFVVPEDCGGIPGFYAVLEAVVDPTRPNRAEAKRFSHKHLLNDTVAPAERVNPEFALALLAGGARRTLAESAACVG